MYLYFVCICYSLFKCGSLHIIQCPYFCDKEMRKIFGQAPFIHFALENRKCLFWREKKNTCNQQTSFVHIVLSEFNAFQLNNERRYVRHSTVGYAEYRVHSITIPFTKCYSICNLYHLLFKFAMAVSASWRNLWANIIECLYGGKNNGRKKRHLFHDT